MGLVIQIALGIVLAYLIIANLDWVMRFALGAIGVAVLLAVLSAIAYFGMEYKNELLALVIAIVVIPFLCILLVLFIATFGVFSERSSFVCSIYKSQLKNYKEYENPSKILNFYEYMSDRFNLGLLTIGFLLVVALITSIIGINVFELDYFGAFATPIIYALLFVLNPLQPSKKPLSRKRILAMIEKRRNLGYDTSELETMLNTLKK